MLTRFAVIKKLRVLQRDGRGTKGKILRRDGVLKGGEILTPF